MMEKLHDMRKEKRLSDFTIKVGNEEFSVHKNVMSAGSDYFDAMLSHDNLESNTGIVDMKEVDVDSVKVCIDYIYTGNASITLEESEQLLHAANIMQLSRFCEKIAEFLKKNLSSKSFFYVRQLAEKFNLKGLEKSCDEYGVIHLGSIAEEVEFNKLDKDYVMFLITYKRSSYSEDSKLSVLLQWIKAEVETRAEYFIKMVQKLQIDKISSSYGSCLARNDSFCSKSLEFIKLLYLADKSCDKIEKVNVCPSSPFYDEGVLLFDKKSKSLQVYCPIEETFNKLKQLNENMLCGKYTAVCLQEFVFVLLPNRKVYRVSAWEAQSTWTEMENMMKEHGQCIRAVVHNNFIYVCGKKTMERYNNNGNNWENVACSTIEPDENALVTFGDEIYVIGGYNRGKRVAKYSPHIGSWSSVKLMNVGRRTPTAAVYDDRIYVAGGWNGSSYLSSTEFFNPVYNTWTNVASMSIPQDKFGLCVVNKNLFAVEIEFEPYSIKEYDPEKQWKNWTDMEIMTTASIAIRIPLYWFDCL
ncbi:kelch-like protein 38 [Styela clava]